MSEGDLGPRVHRGRCFDVHRGHRDGRDVAHKVPTAADPRSPLFTASTTVGGVSTVWSLMSDTRSHAAAEASPDERRAMLDELLASEAHVLEHHGPAWGTELLSFDESPARPVLETPWHDAPPLHTLSRSEQRTMLPRLLPALWDALADHPHGDLSPSNLLVRRAPDGSPRPVLIDPAALVVHGTVYYIAAITSELTATVMTTGAYYPLLPPHYASTLRLADRPSLADHVQDFVASLTLSHHAPPLVTPRHTAHAVGPIGRGLEASFVLEGDEPDSMGDRALRGYPRPTRQPSGEPHPADLLALGVIAYELLTGRHPFSSAPHDPLWVGLDALDNRVQGLEALTELLARDILPPSRFARGVTAAEDRLALALLSLAVPSQVALVRLCDAVS